MNSFSFSVPDAHEHRQYADDVDLRARIAALESRVNDLFNLFGRIIGGPMPAPAVGTPQPMEPGAPLPVTLDEPMMGSGRRSTVEYRRAAEERRQQRDLMANPPDLTAEAGV